MENINDTNVNNLIDLENFDEALPNNEPLLRGVYEYGFSEMSKVQSRALKPIIDGLDVVVQAPAGSGKTAVYVIGGCDRIDPKIKSPQVLIIVNTKELASQVSNVSRHLSTHMNIGVSMCIGGIGNLDVTKNLEQARTSQFLVGTPGRLCDLIKRGKNKLLNNLKLLVLDEADILLDDGFVEDIKMIMRNKPDSCQVCLFSATYPRKILDLTQYFMTNPIRITIEKEKISFDKIKNYYVNVQRNDYKYDVIVDIYQHISVCQTIIFVNETRNANSIADKLIEDGHAVGVTHSELDDVSRIEVLKKFRLGQIRILVATDLISRGIDIQDVGLVINYDIPRNPNSYVHRVGRGGRNGKLGVSITMVTDHESDNRKMINIEKLFKIRFETLPSLDTINNFLLGKNGYNFNITN